MAELGQAAIWLSVFSCLWAIAMLGMGLRGKNYNAILSGRNGVIGTFALISLATGALIYSFITNDFSMRYVAEVSSYDQPLLYKITALWGRMSGSLLFWLWLVTLFGALVVWTNRRASDHLSDYALIPISIVSLFFIILVTGLIEGVYNPLARFPNGGVVPDGAGMNPLLQTPSMAFHPPSLYVGFVGLTVPFAFGIGALLAGRIGSDWLFRSRRWMMFSWLALTIGVALGGNWAYRELGWGGYWAWDPVENASFMPWLLGTAYLHSVMIQEKRNMLKLWNIILITLAFEFTLLGTFITRSGIISSVHAFAQSDIGHYFLTFIFLSLVGVIWLIYHRWNDLKSPNHLDSLLSRESSFLLNNWMLVGLTLIILWGTLWPIITEGVTGAKAAVPESFFNQVVVIPGLLLLVLTGVGPIISWKKLTPSNFKRMFAKPIVLGVIAGVLTWGYLAWKGHTMPIYSVLCVFSSVFVLAAIFDEFYRGSKLRAKRQGTSFFGGLTRLIQRNKRRYGGYIVHIGIVLVYIGIMGSKGYSLLESKSLRLGETMEVGNYQLTLQDAFLEKHANYSLGGVLFAVKKNGKSIGTMRPARGFYHKAGQGDQDTIESAIRHQGLNDLYIALGPLPENVPAYVQSGEAVPVQVYHNPLVNLVWVGVAIMVIGGGVAFLEKRQEK
ncbi:MAG: heme lyase CcmF/NrfE family subunit [Candidatus Poribacteria bacterium]|nr:heme lyase CcmF/NrfE family subunit [Candidatus Poribacteria bacterium]